MTEAAWQAVRWLSPGSRLEIPLFQVIYMVDEFDLLAGLFLPKGFSENTTLADEMQQPRYCHSTKTIDVS